MTEIDRESRGDGARRSYERPVLKEFGSLFMLTKKITSTKPNTDGGLGMTNKS